MGEVKIIARFVKGTKRIRPPKPRITNVWDPVPVLHHLKDWGPISSLNFTKLTRRTMVLFLLATGQRLQALHKLKRVDCQWEESSVKIVYSDKLKTNDPTVNPLSLTFIRYEDEELCVFAHLWAYLADGRSTSAAPYVFSTTRTPTTRATPATISRQVKTALVNAGVNAGFTAYSARHAATSAAARASVPINSIMNSAGWARETTFQRFYNRPLQRPEVTETNFIPDILN
jgi:integrase